MFLETFQVTSSSSVDSTNIPATLACMTENLQPRARATEAYQDDNAAYRTEERSVRATDQRSQFSGIYHMLVTCQAIDL